jgi:BirA family biotin operon repressor/biotin-[acetyl-CoA-carboxylase] ligase
METSQPVENPWPGACVELRERTVSTMDDAFDLASGRGCPTGSVAVAAFQDRGRGRVPGHAWLSPAGESLLATVVLRMPDIPFPLSQLPLRAGVAALRAVQAASGVRALIKWPNDIMAGDRKLAGVLCEARGVIVLAGFGVNCLQSGFSDEIAATACSLLQLCGRGIPPLELLPVLLRSLKECMSGSGWLDELRGSLYRKGETVRVDMPGAGSKVQGVLCDVDEEGRLVLELRDGRRERISQGELAAGP